MEAKFLVGLLGNRFFLNQCSPLAPGIHIFQGCSNVGQVQKQFFKLGEISTLSSLIL